MAARSFLRFAALAALLLSAAACKYPYDLDIDGQSQYPLVVEGDILVGASTTLRFSYAQPLDDKLVVPGFQEAYMNFLAFKVSGYIEGEDGTRIDGHLPTPSDGLADRMIFDTENLRAGQRYRLHLETMSSYDHFVNRTFETDWMDVLPAPVIDNLSYSKHGDYNELWLGLSMHCNGASHFRWSFKEDWEYHSDMHASYYYDPISKTIQSGDGGVYRCWQSEVNSAINVFSTENQVEDRFEDLAFYRIPRGDRRLQVLYRVTLTLEALSEDAYNFWRTVRENTDEQGSIFAPTPSEMTSNLRCISHPDFRVLGYINTAAAAQAVMYYDNSLEKFHSPPAKGYFQTDEYRYENSPRYNEANYAQGRRIWYGEWEGVSEKPTHLVWVEAKCIDCRLSGGTTVRPADWPEDKKED